MTFIWIAAGLVLLYLFFTDPRFMLGAAAVSFVLYLLERAGVMQAGPVTALARYFLAISIFIAIPIALIFIFGG